MTYITVQQFTPSPVTGHWSPITGHWSPITGHRSPVTSNPSPVTCHLSHATTMVQKLKSWSFLNIKSHN